jgi:type VI secretion system secreted protein Hcp
MRSSLDFSTRARSAAIVVIACALWLLPSVTHGAAFIKFDGVDGESVFVDYEGWSMIRGFSQAISREVDPSGGSTRGRGDAQFTDIFCTKELDKSSPKLAEAIAKGTVFPKVEIHLTRNNPAGGGQIPYLKYELKNVLISSYNLTGHTTPGSNNYESVALNFEEITMTYTEYDEEGNIKGNVEYSWNLETATP